MQLNKLRQNEVVDATWERGDETLNLRIKRGIMTPRFLREIRQLSQDTKDKEQFEQADEVQTYQIMILVRVIDSWDMRDPSQLSEGFQRILRGEIVGDADKQESLLADAKAALEKTVALICEETFLDCDIQVISDLFTFVMETATGKKTELTDSTTTPMSEQSESITTHAVN